ncbi:MAG TPA: cytochrome c oxidase subunit II [Rhizobiaceae bacterium]|nr:cytochrome c oxidase subunit II [Rhizobiaceae bacterium]
MRRASAIAFVAVLQAVAPASGATQSAFEPMGPASAELFRLIWLFTALSAVIWLGVIAVLITTLVRRDGARADPLALDPSAERRATGWVTIATAGTAIVLIGLALLSYFSNRTLAGIGADASLTIRLTGHQWWWEVRYENEQPSKVVTTANEIHIPTGEPVRLVLASTDVIHSFWVPSLAGKLDLIPGHQNVLEFRADKSGVYRGQCAEFCGFQHAHMAIMIIAEPRPEFDAWLEHQLQPAAQPASAEEQAGHDRFMNRPCVMCHKIGGTAAGGTVGPDLTHVSSRTTLAAGTLPMDEPSLAAWITDPQSFKPGAHMPIVDLSGDELSSIAAYLGNLK